MMARNLLSVPYDGLAMLEQWGIVDRIVDRSGTRALGRHTILKFLQSASGGSGSMTSRQPRTLSFVLAAAIAVGASILGGWALAGAAGEGAGIVGAVLIGAGTFTLGALVASEAAAARDLARGAANAPINRAGRRRPPRDSGPQGPEDDAAVAREDLDAFNASVSHDLRSPIGAILNFATVLEEDYGAELDPEARAILGRIRRSGRSALATLDGLLRLSRAGRHELRPEPLEMEELVRDVVGALRSSGRQVDLAVARLPSAVADAALLREVFTELVGNAIKFSARSEKPRIGIGGHREPDGSVVYWVADEGVGFDARFTANLFRAFERLHSRDEFAGAGIGLAVVRRIVERHGGSVWAESGPETGARFFFTLPAGHRVAGGEAGT
jgi:signal transduction histidine kinase